MQAFTADDESSTFLHLQTINNNVQIMLSRVRRAGISADCTIQHCWKNRNIWTFVVILFPFLPVQFCSPVRITNGLLITARNILKVIAEEKDLVGWFVQYAFVLWQRETNQFVFKNVSFSKPENCHSLLTKKGSYWTRKDWMFLSIIELSRYDWTESNWARNYIWYSSPSAPNFLWMEQYKTRVTCTLLCWLRNKICESFNSDCMEDITS